MTSRDKLLSKIRREANSADPAAKMIEQLLRENASLRNRNGRLTVRAEWLEMLYRTWYDSNGNQQAFPLDSINQATANRIYLTKEHHARGDLIAKLKAEVERLKVKAEAMRKGVAYFVAASGLSESRIAAISETVELKIRDEFGPIT